MNLVSVISISIAVILTIFAIYMFLKVNRILTDLDEMLENAINGTYEEENYDESKISKLEAKLSRFLSSSKLSLKRLEEQQNQIEQTVSDLSHQTKTPVANLLLYTEYLGEKNLGSEEKKLIKRIEEQTEKLNFLIQSLVKISRLEHELITVHCTKHSLDECLKEVFALYEGKAIEKGINLQIEYGEAWAVFDEKWTLEALGNIVDNAIKYTGLGGNVKISVKEYEMFSMVQIEDDGMGIAKEELASVFSRFYRSQKVNQMPGVGIGLYLARKIVSLEGGYIKVFSEEGKGAKFQVYFTKTEH